MNIFNDNLKTIYPDIMRVAKKMTKYNIDDAEDLVQKALLKALEKQHLYKGGNLTGWVVRIMQNIFRDELRKTKGKDFDEIEENTLPHYDPDLEIFDVNKALSKLGDKCRKILLLIAEEYKYAEISEKLSIPLGTTMSRLLRCRKQLHQELYGSSQYNEI